MEQLILQAIAGAVGGNVAGKSMKSSAMGTLGNTIAGLVGGGVLGQIVTMLFSSGAVEAAVGAAGFDLASIITSVASGGIGGAVLTAAIGMLKNRSA
jgi:uncharacterized membrane protein YeaQ/YmgE (transglycosylase-associated protein family)